MEQQFCPYCEYPDIEKDHQLYDDERGLVDIWYCPECDSLFDEEEIVTESDLRDRGN